MVYETYCTHYDPTLQMLKKAYLLPIPADFSRIAVLFILFSAATLCDDFV